MRIFVGKQLNLYGAIRAIRPGAEIVIKPTMRCNLACEYCSVEFAGGSCWVEYAPDRPWWMWRDQLTEKIIPKYKRIKQVFIGGGEPTLYGDLPLLVNWLTRRKGIPTYIVSNLMIDRSREFSWCPLVKIKATFHADALRRFPDAADRFRKHLHAYRKKFLVEHDEFVDTAPDGIPNVNGSNIRHKVTPETANFQPTDQYGPDGQFYPRDEKPDKAKYDARRKRYEGWVTNPNRKRLLKN